MYICLRFCLFVFVFFFAAPECAVFIFAMDSFSTVLLNHTFVHLWNYQFKNIVISTVAVNSANRSREVSLTGRFASSLM